MPRIEKLNTLDIVSSHLIWALPYHAHDSDHSVVPWLYQAVTFDPVQNLCIFSKGFKRKPNKDHSAKAELAVAGGFELS